MFSISYLHPSPEWVSVLGSGFLIVLCSILSDAVLFCFAGGGAAHFAHCGP